jgi:hypothetical protein
VIYVVFWAVLGAALAGFGGGWCVTTRPERLKVARLADPAPLPGESYGEFPVDTAPLLLLSVAAAALKSHELEVEAMCVAAEQLIGPVPNG